MTRTRRLPRNGPPTRFACRIASFWLVATALAFEAGPAWPGYLLGGLLTTVAAIVAVTHVCIPSFTHHILFGDRALTYGALPGRSQVRSV